jgi:hypothetical protein
MGLAAEISVRGTEVEIRGVAVMRIAAAVQFDSAVEFDGTTRFDAAVDINAAVDIDSTLDVLGLVTTRAGIDNIAGQIRNRNLGSAASPAFVLDDGALGTDAGFYVSSISMGFSVGATERVLINAGGVNLSQGLYMSGSSAFINLPQITTPSAPAAGTTVVYGVDNGGGKTQLRALFDTGAAQAIATEP